MVMKYVVKKLPVKVFIDVLDKDIDEFLNVKREMMNLKFFEMNKDRYVAKVYLNNPEKKLPIPMEYLYNNNPVMIIAKDEEKIRNELENLKIYDNQLVHMYVVNDYNNLKKEINDFIELAYQFKVRK